MSKTTIFLMIMIDFKKVKKKTLSRVGWLPKDGST